MIASNDRAEAKRRFREKVAAQKALPASERIANTLHATNSHADARALLDEFRAEVARNVREGSAGIVRSFIPDHPADDEQKAVAYALTLAADAIERGRR